MSEVMEDGAFAKSGSVPARSLRIFSACLQTASTIPYTASAIIGPRGAKMSVAGTTETAAQTDPRDTFLLSSDTIKKTTRMQTKTRQSIIQPIAAPVAIPFPPLKLWKTGKQCPVMLAIPPRHIPTSPRSARPISMAASAFKKSNNNVAIPAAQPNTRVILVAPAFPLPSLRISLPISRERIMEKLREPSR